MCSLLYLAIYFCSSICLQRRGSHMALNQLYDVFLIIQQTKKKKNVKFSFKLKQNKNKKQNPL